MEFDDRLGDGKAETRPLLSLVIIRAELREFAEDLREIVMGDPHAGVRHAALQLVFLSAD